MLAYSKTGNGICYFLEAAKKEPYVGLYLLKENFMWPTFEDETHVLSFLFHVLIFLFVKVTF